jgi:hypothetical protein
VKIVKRDRDPSFDRLLAEALDARAAAPPEGACLDAETLAARAEGTLGRQEREAADTHAADCARCQAMLAVMIRTTPDPTAAAKPAWRRSPLSWLIPVTASAAAVILWAVVPWRPPSEPRPGPVSTVATTTSAAAPAGDEPAKFQSETRIPSRGVAAPSVPNAPAAVEASPARADASSDDVAAATPGPRDQRDRDQNASTSLDANASAEPERAGRQARAPAREGGAPSPEAPAPPAAAAAPRTFALAKSAAPATIIESPSPSIRWRIVPGGVERSSDGGASWQAQDTGVSVTLAAGAAVSPTVCWLVGAGGAVLLSIDGRSWRRLPFPEPTPLAAVRATDDKTATVTAADGRSFSTADGGLTWLQSRAN